MPTKTSQKPSISDPASPAEPFVGRHQVTRLVLGDLENGQNVSIVGPDRIGKTSFLRHVADPQVRATFQIAEEHVFVCLDCAALARDGQGTWHAQEAWYQCIEEATIRRIGQIKPEQVGEIQGRFQESVQGTNVWTPSRRMGRLFRAVQEQGIQVVLALDDFEKLTESPHLDERFLNTSKALNDEHAVTYLVTSLLPLHELTPILSVDSPYFGMFFQRGSSARDLFGPLEAQESREFVWALIQQAGMEEPDDSVVHCILDLGENRPYTLKRAGQIAVRLWASDPKIEPQQLCRRIRGKFG